MNSVAELPLNAADYCRRARRIRASFSRDPFLRYHGLHNLAKEQNKQVRIAAEAATVEASRGLRNRDLELVPRIAIARVKAARRRVAPLVESNAAEQDFIGHIATRLHPFGFTFSDRAQLLDTAEQLGISRFRANVILAMYEHQAGHRNSTTKSTKTALPVRRGMSAFMVVFFVQIIVLSVIVWMCSR